MRQRDWMIVAFAAGAFAGIAGLVWLMTSDKPGAKPNGAAGTESVVAAAEPKVGGPTLLFWEYGPPRKAGDLTVHAYRQREGDQAPLYGIYFGGDTVLSVEDVQSMLKHHEKYKNIKITSANEIKESSIRWTGKSLISSDTFRVRYNVHSSEWVMGTPGGSFKVNAAECMTAIGEALKDLEAMKKVPFTAGP